MQPPGTGKALSAWAGGTEQMYVDATALHAGPGLTGTPLAYGTFNADGSKAAGSANISCSALGSAGAYYYDCTLSCYTPSTHVAVATAVNLNAHPVFITTGSPGTGTVRVRLFDFNSGAPAMVQGVFHIVVFKP